MNLQTNLFKQLVGFLASLELFFMPSSLPVLDSSGSKQCEEAGESSSSHSLWLDPFQPQDTAVVWFSAKNLLQATALMPAKSR